ncbi:MAG: CocE/NonD family hydrolase [Nevskia sp.]|nr:CocE/NonD family hydrolase [Nevskia sp.]
MTKITTALGLLLLALAAAAAPAEEPAQQPAAQFDFHAPQGAADSAAPAAMRDLAERILPVYQDADRERYLDTLSVLQLAAGNYAAADDSRQSLRERRQGAKAGVDGPGVGLDLYTHAKAVEAASGVPFARAFKQAFHDTVSRLGDREAYGTLAWLGTPLPPLRDALQQSLDRLRGGDRVALEPALELIRAWLSYDVHGACAPLIEALAEEDDRRRYLAEATSIAGHDGLIQVRLVRPKAGPKPLPALLEFALAGDPGQARASAAHGYVGVLATADNVAVPFERDGEDVRAVIQWIVRQPWSDGRVGMYGDGYGGFAAWAAARHPPAGLKAIASSDAMVPGIDFPMQGRIYRNDAYRWAREAAGEAGGNDAQWRALDQRWYRSGRSFRDLDLVAGAPSRMFRRWLNHPSYDRYWQKMIPFQEQFAKVHIPVLAIAGYYAEGEAGALYYFSQHRHYQPDADHTLLIGPYDDNAARGTPPPLLRGYALDAAAQVDLRELRYQWLDHVFRNAPLPPLLQDRVNYEVMGANQWRHAASLDAVAGSRLRFYLDGTGSGDRLRLIQAPPKGVAAQQKIRLADRGDAELPAPPAIVGKAPTARYSLSFVSDALPQPLEVAGLPAGQLDFKINKMDLDLNLALYELQPDGTCVELFDPYEFRASYAHDPVHRHLLKAGERQQLKFTVERMSGRLLQAGSRLLLVLGVNKRPDREVNYGTGNDVSADSAADAGSRLKIEWYGEGSYIELPVRK